jgi:hypothetical protein
MVAHAGGVDEIAGLRAGVFGARGEGAEVVEADIAIFADQPGHAPMAQRRQRKRALDFGDVRRQPCVFKAIDERGVETAWR